MLLWEGRIKTFISSLNDLNNHQSVEVSVTKFICIQIVHQVWSFELRDGCNLPFDHFVILTDYGWKALSVLTWPLWFAVLAKNCDKIRLCHSLLFVFSFKLFYHTWFQSPPWISEKNCGCLFLMWAFRVITQEAFLPSSRRFRSP